MSRWWTSARARRKPVEVAVKVIRRCYQRTIHVNKVAFRRSLSWEKHRRREDGGIVAGGGCHGVANPEYGSHDNTSVVFNRHSTFEKADYFSTSVTSKDTSTGWEYRSVTVCGC